MTSPILFKKANIFLILLYNIFMLKVKVDQDKCIGCGLCISLAPKSFKLIDDGKSEAINPPGDDEATIKSTVESCPVQGIIITKE